MEELELEQQIHDYIKTLYKAEYVGLLKVNKLNPGFSLTIGLPSYMSPTTISSDHVTEEDFLNFIFEELRTRNYMRVEFYKVIKEKNDSKEE